MCPRTKFGTCCGNCWSTRYDLQDITYMSSYIVKSPCFVLLLIFSVPFCAFYVLLNICQAVVCMRKFSTTCFTCTGLCLSHSRAWPPRATCVVLTPHKALFVNVHAKSMAMHSMCSQNLPRVFLKVWELL